MNITASGTLAVGVRLPPWKCEHCESVVEGSYHLCPKGLARYTVSGNRITPIDSSGEKSDV